MTSPIVRMSAAPTTDVCPHCQGQMTVIQIIPLLFALESAKYKCTKCDSEVERTFHSPSSEPRWQRGGFERAR